MSDTQGGSKASRVICSVADYHARTQKLREARSDDFTFNQGGEGQWLPADLAKLKNKKRPAVTFNLAGAVVNFLAGYQLTREQDLRAYPRGAEDERLGRIMTSLIKYGFDRTNARHTQHLGFRKGIIGGQVAFEVSHNYEYTDDYLEGDCDLTVLEHDTWGYELGARRYDKNDAAYQFKMSWLNVEDAKRKWPAFATQFTGAMRKDWMREDPTLTGVPDHFREHLVDRESNRVRVVQFWERTPVEVTLLVNNQTGDVQRMESAKVAERFLRNLHDTKGAEAAAQYDIQTATSQSALINKATGAVHTFVKPEHAEEALETVKKQAGKAAMATFDLVTRDTTTLRVTNVAAGQELDEKPAPISSDWRYPFIPFTCYQDTDDTMAIKGIIRDIKDPAREVNWHHSTALDALVRGPKGGVWVNKQENVDLSKLREQYSEAGFIGEYAGQPPIPIQPQALSQGDLELLQMNVDMIMRISNVNAEMLGQTTQKTVSGRAIQSRQSSGAVGVGTVFFNWMETQKLIGQLWMRHIQKYYSPDKMARIIGQEQKHLQAVGLAPPQEIPEEQMYEMYKQVQQIDMDIAMDFQENTITARQAMSKQLMELKAIGVPIPLPLIVESLDPPYKQEILTALAKQGEQPVDPNMQKVLSAGQGSSPDGVNTSQ